MTLLQNGELHALRQNNVIFGNIVLEPNSQSGKGGGIT
jgi:hypothetical protein